MRRFWIWQVALTALILSAYVPFLGSRMIRTAGDEKVYVSQSLEMARDGRWFVQTLQDKPDYYKGPLHYALVHEGISVFGYSPWALLYMNVVFLLIGAWSLSALVVRRYPDWPELGFWAGSAFALSIGIYAHAFASQMEIELAGLFALALFLLDRATERGLWGFWFWTVAAIAGWLKAPLHSVFLGVSAVLYWTLAGQFLVRIRDPKAWGAALWGVALGAAGFLPAYLADRENFLSKYLLKEIFDKSTTQQPALVPIVSTFGFYLFPWVLLALAAYLHSVFSLPRWLKDRPYRNGILLVLCFCAPSVGFFLWNPYRFENYNLPVISAVIFLIAVLLAEVRRSPLWRAFLRVLMRLTSLIFLALPIAISVFYWHFSPLPAWWPIWLLPAIWIGSGISAVGWWSSLRFGETLHVTRLTWSSLGIYWALGTLFVVLGERELVDLKDVLRDPLLRSARISYVNLQQNIWSEWGLLGFFIGRPVEGKHTPESLKEAFLRGDLILVANGEGRETFDRFVAGLPGERFEERKWKRWRTHGKAESGQPLWREAWEKRDLSLFEKDYYIISRVSPVR